MQLYGRYTRVGALDLHNLIHGLPGTDPDGKSTHTKEREREGERESARHTARTRLKIKLFDLREPRGGGRYVPRSTCPALPKSHRPSQAGTGILSSRIPGLGRAGLPGWLPVYGDWPGWTAICLRHHRSAGDTAGHLMMET